MNFNAFVAPLVEKELVTPRAISRNLSKRLVDHRVMRLDGLFSEDLDDDDGADPPKQGSLEFVEPELRREGDDAPSGTWNQVVP